MEEKKKFGVLSVIVSLFTIIVLMLTLTNLLDYMGVTIPGQEEKLIENMLVSIKDGKKFLITNKDSTENFDYAIDRIYGDPDLFWLNSKCYRMSIGKLNILMLKSKYDDVEEKQKEIDNVVNDMIQTNITKDMSEYDKVLAVHDWLCSHIKYEEMDADEDQDIYGAIVLKKARCAGYAKAFTYILNKIGIQSEVISGISIDSVGTKVEHAWNLIYMDGDPYYFDITWDDTDDETICNYHWFGLTKEEFEKSHTPNSGYDWLDASATKYNYYTLNGMELYEYAPSTLAAQIKKQGKNINIKCRNTDVKDDVIKALQDPEELGKVMYAANITSVQSIEFTQSINSNCIHIDLKI